MAPTREQSGVGHGISMHDLHVYPWRMDGATGYAVHGTPTDCVKVAIFDLMREMRSEMRALRASMEEMRREVRQLSRSSLR